MCRMSTMAAWCAVSTLFLPLGRADEAKTILRNLGGQRALVVLVGTGWGKTAIALAKQSESLVYLQTPDESDAVKARTLAYDTGLLGVRVFVDTGNTDRIHLADNLADAVAIRQVRTPRAELLRVVRPGGKLFLGDKIVEKPVPDGIDDWSHPYHGPDNNPLSKDRLARAPYLTQFLATPWYGPMPEVTLSSAGRLFKAFGHLAFKKREWAMLSKLVVLNGYNGIRLWERDLVPGFMIHRNTMIATPDIFYLADHQSCKLLDAATGKLLDEIVVPEGISDGPVWKWMALQDGVLYALVGENEKLHPVHKGTRTQTGWPWATVRQTYGGYLETWGFGRTLFAMNPKTKKMHWVKRFDDRIDSRAVCMANGRIFLYSHGKWIKAIDSRTGKPLWHTADQTILDAIGEHDPAQNPRLGYATSVYAKCNDKGLYFAGPQRRKLVAIDARTGKLMWIHEDGNVQLVLRDDGLYAMGRLNTSKKLDYLTGKMLADLQCFRGNCTRATGTIDSIFARGYRHSGTLRFDVNDNKPHRLPGMRPACQDGVVVANGLLYWGPWMCDCNHSLVGVISLGPAGQFNFQAKANERERLQSYGIQDVQPVKSDEKDWPTYRQNVLRSGHTPVPLAKTATLQWQFTPPAQVTPTAPIAVADFTYVASSDGVVHAFDSKTGQERWHAFTGGPISYPPAVWQGRLFVGSGDGYVYAFDAQNGRQLWRFRAAPVERRIPVYGKLCSTWPVASGVLVHEGILYAAAGIICHDGTHVYALDAKSGKLLWQNNESGSLAGEGEVVGVSVQGHLLFHDGKLYLAGGNVVSPAIYDARTGQCLNELKAKPTKTLDDHWQMQRASRGSELFLVEGRVITAGRMLYSPVERGPASRYHAMYSLQVSAGNTVIEGTDQLIQRVEPKGPDGKPKRIWKDTRFAQTDGVVLAQNAVAVIGRLAGPAPEAETQPALVVFDLSDGTVLSSRKLPAPPAKWGIAIDRSGRILVTLIDGRVLCFA
ncbi:MAG: hypothetical protein KatS3mg105_4797 [Gemmatales bacterium]|nr:MAG: hypothetical protein KatS3mg105_4797 [Gemmatales bacterium]